MIERCTWSPPTCGRHWRRRRRSASACWPSRRRSRASRSSGRSASPAATVVSTTGANPRWRPRRWLASTASAPPFSTGADVLFVAYFATAELTCFHALGWPMPRRVLDLYAEFRNVTSGLAAVGGHGLVGAMLAYGLPCIDAAEKDAMRELIL